MRDSYRALLSISSVAAAVVLSGCSSSSRVSHVTPPPSNPPPAITVTSVSPAPNAPCVSPTKAITITFSTGADASTLTSSNIAISGPGNTAIQAKITYDATTDTATVTPNAALPSGTISVVVNNVTSTAGGKMTATL
jgi:Bacterial Ig-like domain